MPLGLPGVSATLIPVVVHAYPTDFTFACFPTLALVTAFVLASFLLGLFGTLQGARRSGGNQVGILTSAWRCPCPPDLLRSWCRLP